MILKGLISSLNTTDKTAEVVLPEYDDAVTKPLRFYHEADFESKAVGDFVLVAVLNNDLNDCIII